MEAAAMLTITSSTSFIPMDLIAKNPNVAIRLSDVFCGSLSMVVVVVLCWFIYSKVMQEIHTTKYYAK